jgi:transposase-like protein
MRQQYTEEKKQSVLKKLLPPYNVAIPELSRAEGMPTTTLYSWRSEERKRGNMTESIQAKSTHFNAAQHLQIIIETARLSELGLGEYCRKKGIYTHDIEVWKTEFIQWKSEKKHSAIDDKKQAKKDKDRIKSLEKELRRKDNALAETAALLVLRKKLQAFYGEGARKINLSR